MPIFSKTIERPIGRRDLEFYESGIVLRMALLLSGYSEERWNTLSYRARMKWLDKGVDATFRLLNDESIVERLPVLAKNLTERLVEQRIINKIIEAGTPQA